MDLSSFNQSFIEQARNVEEGKEQILIKQNEEEKKDFSKKKKKGNTKANKSGAEA